MLHNTNNSNSKRIDKRRYQCDICNKCFTRPSALKTHIYTHTGEKPFECTTPGCGRRFAVISNLRRHFKIHTRMIHSSSSGSVRIPASERLFHVQRLIERTASMQRDSIGNNNDSSSDTSSSSCCSSISTSSNTTVVSSKNVLENDYATTSRYRHPPTSHCYHPHTFRSPLSHPPMASPVVVLSDTPSMITHPKLYHDHFAPSWDHLEG